MTNAIKVIFTVSLAINLLLLGAVGGHVYKENQRHKPPVELDAESKQAIKQNIKQSREAMRDRMREMKTHKDALKKVITAEDFDIKAYNEAIGKMLDMKDGLARERAENMGKTLAKLPKEEREKLTGRFMQGLAGKDGNRDKRRDRRSTDRMPRDRY